MTEPIEKTDTLSAMLEFSGLINSTLDIIEIRRRAIEAATKLVGAETAACCSSTRSPAGCTST